MDFSLNEDHCYDRKIINSVRFIRQI